MTYALPTNVTSHFVDTARLRVHYLRSNGEGEAVIFLHGNIASSLFWDDTLATLPSSYTGIAVDMRSFGDTEPKPVDATRGMGDYADDLEAVMDSLGHNSAHLVGWSTGGLVAMRFAHRPSPTGAFHHAGRLRAPARLRRHGRSRGHSDQR